MTESKCPEPEKVTEEMKKLSKREKLELIAKEGQTLYEYCVSQGFSSKELQSCLKPFHSARPKTQEVLDGSMKTTCGLALLVALIAVFVYHPPAYNMLCVHAKLASMKVLPYWDWTYIYAEDCMIYNNFMRTDNLTKDDCTSCAEVHDRGEIERISNAKQDSVSEEFLWVDYPFVVEDGQRDWPKNQSLTLDEMLKLQTDKKLDNINECLFNTTIQDIDTVADFLELYEKGSLPDEPWLITWENCDHQASKVFRKFYSRPYFFAPMAEASRNSQIFISKGIPAEAEIYDVFNAMSSCSWIAVMSGSVEYTLNSDAACEEFGCGPVSGKTVPGEILVVPQRIWRAELRAASDELTIAIITAVNWDEM